jgi:hypothetical protein
MNASKLVWTVIGFGVATLGAGCATMTPESAAGGPASPFVLAADTISSEARLESAERAARRRLRSERAMRSARAMFAADEAEVLVVPDGIRVRFLSPLFQAGSSRLEAAAFDRLGRLRAAIQLFPRPRVTIHVPAGPEGSTEAVLAQIRANDLRRALVRARIVGEDRAFVRHEPKRGAALEFAIGPASGFDSLEPTPGDMARL